MYSCSFITELGRNTTSAAESWRGTGSKPLRTKPAKKSVLINQRFAKSTVSNNASTVLFLSTYFSRMASHCSLFNSRLGLPGFSKENLIAFFKSPSRPRSQTPSCIRASRLRNLTGITRILLFKTDFPRVLRFPVPLDKGNEGFGDEIARDWEFHACSNSDLGEFLFCDVPCCPIEKMQNFHVNISNFLR